jgi:arsenate reductase (thioredoxin)
VPCIRARSKNRTTPSADIRDAQQERNEFASFGAPVMDFVFTLCDQAAGELCPLMARQSGDRPLGIPDPAAVKGSEAEQRKAFRDAYLALESRIKIFVALPFDKLDRMAIKRGVDEIGRIRAVPKLELP